MVDTSLYLCPRINCLYRFFETCRAVYTKKQHVFHTPGVQVIEHAQPESAGLICTCGNAQDVLISVDRNAKHCIGSTAQALSIFLYLIMDTIYEKQTGIWGLTDVTAILSPAAGSCL